jgi:hypothetical protein
MTLFCFSIWIFIGIGRVLKNMCHSRKRLNTKSLQTNKRRSVVITIRLGSLESQGVCITQYISFVGFRVHTEQTITGHPQLLGSTAGIWQP